MILTFLFLLVLDISISKETYAYPESEDALISVCKNLPIAAFKSVHVSALTFENASMMLSYIPDHEYSFHPHNEAS